MKNFKYIKDFMSLNFDIWNKGKFGSMGLTIGWYLLYGGLVGVFIVCMKFGWVEGCWWERFLFAFGCSFGIKLITGGRLWKGDIKNQGIKGVKKIDNEFNECINREIKIKKMNNLNMIYLMNNRYIKNIKEKVMKLCILNWFLKLIGFILILIGLGSGYNIYCEGTDVVNNNNNSNSNSNSNSGGNNDNNNTDKENDRIELALFNILYHLLKDMIIETVEIIIVGIISGGAGVKIYNSIIKICCRLPMVQRVVIGVASVGLTTLGVSAGCVIGLEAINKIFRKNNIEINISGGGNISSSKDGNESNVKDLIIPSILEEEVSPWQIILNFEILFCVLMLLFIGITILIWLHKLYINSGLNIISKVFSKKIADIYERFKRKIDKIRRAYLIILVIITVIAFLFYIFVNIFVNVDISNNIDDSIDILIRMKKSIILLLSLKSNFNVYTNNMEPNKYLNTWSKIENKKRNNMSEDIYLDWVSLLNQESKDKEAENIISVGDENVTRNNSTSSDKNIITFSTEEIEEKIMNLSSLSENLINKKIVVRDTESTESIDKKLDLTKVDEEFKNILIYLKISSSYLTKKNYFKLVNTLLESLSRIGVNKEYFKELEEILLKWKKDISSSINYNINLEDNPIFNKYFYLYVELSELIKKKNAKINLNIWNDFILLLDSSEKFKHAELKKINEKIINTLKQEYKRIDDEIWYKEYPQRKKRKRNSEDSSEKIIKYFKDSDYQKLLNNKLLDLLNELKKEQIELLTNQNIERVKEFSKLIDYIEDVIFQFFENIIVELLDTGYISKTYSDNPKIIKKVLKKDQELAMELYNEQQSSDLSVLLNNLKKIKSIEISKDKLSKWKTGNNSLFDNIDKIFQSNISQKGKQIALEKVIFEYDIKFFIENMQVISNEIKIFSQEYSNISTNYDNLIKDYTKYRSIKLKKLFKKDKTNAIIILMLIYLNKDQNISLIFKFILNKILFNNQYPDGINKTVLLFQLAKYFTKIFMLSKENKKNNVFESVKNVCSYSELKDLIKKLDENALLKLGDTLYSLVVENSKLIETELRTISITNKELVVKIHSIYLNKLINSNISLSLLPMVSEPKDVESNGDYYPYYLTNTNVLGLEECKVIKGKYDQKFYTKGSKQFYEGINSMNKIKFKINNEMLEFVISEWDYKESIFFKGYNMLKEISENDSKVIKQEKLKHNAVYSLYLNIIQIAVLFKDQTFYLPVYADFRGRIYTLSNYLSYQGNDLARSLLLFDTEEYLNKEGLEFLKIYFTNLAGFDKQSWNDRLNKSEDLWLKYDQAIMDYLFENSKDKIDKFLFNVSEPFQLHSIGLAIHKYKENKDRGKVIIRNPILFDATCSGIQHISALTLDKNLSIYSNVFTDKLNPSTEKPEDFYMYALGLINDKLLNSDNPNIQNIKLKRNLIKTTVMTIPYNISLTGIGEQLEEHFKKFWKINNYEYIIPAEFTINGISFSITSKEFGLFTKIIYEVLIKDIPSLKTLTKYFKNILNILNSLNLPINWETPAGLNINYQQIKFHSKVIKNNLIPGSKTITIAVPTDKIDKVKILRSFMPNFIHSLDASNVHLLINYLSKEDNISFYTIHDCFASTPNKIGILEKTVKRAFIDIYFKDEGYLLKTHKNFIKEIKDKFEIKIINDKNCVEIVNSTKEKEYLELPELPKEFQKNNLNDFIKGLLHSKYFIG